MNVISVRNAHQALPVALYNLATFGQIRESRAGVVLETPWPVSTVYSHPCERVVFWPQRDYNVAFVLYEALWMLAGRSDLAPLTRYVHDFGKYSDNGASLHGAYGDRWRNAFGVDQLSLIINRLKTNPDDRRCVLQMWDCVMDLDRDSKDIPCNDTATFQIGTDGRLNLVVFCRSNDVLWGAYYANAFHFSFLLEYMACSIGVPVGTYTQVSVNWHGYAETLTQVEGLEKFARLRMDCPYSLGEVRALPLGGTQEQLDGIVLDLLHAADEPLVINFDLPWADAAAAVLRAHELWRTHAAPERYQLALQELHYAPSCDWVVSMQQWIQRRYDKWQAKMDGHKEVAVS